MKDIVKIYAYYNGEPLCKTYKGDVCVGVETTTSDMIGEHNKSPISCAGEGCEICHPELKKNPK